MNDQRQLPTKGNESHFRLYVQILMESNHTQFITIDRDPYFCEFNDERVLLGTYLRNHEPVFST